MRIISIQWQTTPHKKTTTFVINGPNESNKKGSGKKVCCDYKNSHGIIGKHGEQGKTTHGSMI